jgi:catechol 2,3-dioxygenase-like lactoylglutathione lyase family enzyme
MLGDANLVTFVSTSDPERAKAFYGGLLGLELVEQTPFACVFRTPNAELRVTTVSDVAAAPYTVLGWRVAEIEASVRDLNARGAEPLRYEGLEQDELGIWRSPGGARVAWFKDPDGNVLSLTQPDPSHSSR